MALTKIQIDNFVVFKHIEVNPSQGVNVIIGKNGLGKTQLLKAIYADIDISNNDNKKDFADYFKRGESNEFLIANKGERDLSIQLFDNTDGQENIEHKVELSLGLRQNGAGDILASDAYNISISLFNKPISTVFLPVKDMLTHAKGLLSMGDKYREFPFDRTLTDVIRLANQWTLKNPPSLALNILPMLEKMIDGTIEVVNEEFFVRKHDGSLVNFAVEAEGLKKIGLLWQLLMNESITEDSILLWDEPEANLNPEYLPILVECLLELSRHGVQIFVSTHNYLFAKYFDVRKKDGDDVAYHALYQDEEDVVCCEKSDRFDELKHNAIMDAYNKLLDEVYGLQVGE
ncbi:ATP/GTP-binding protein [Selenomonas ruminantium]|uniref:AAA family ATPase n=1 Tax=Selenomonas ruminantium TaxID=971 RepID=UPI0026EF7FD9|nr:ATP-binding protein [Selenomonas ruminantium]